MIQIGLMLTGGSWKHSSPIRRTEGTSPAMLRSQAWERRPHTVCTKTAHKQNRFNVVSSHAHASRNFLETCNRDGRRFLHKRSHASVPKKKTETPRKVCSPYSHLERAMSHL